MSILGKWFKQDAKERLEQKTVGSDVVEEKNADVVASTEIKDDVVRYHVASPVLVKPQVTEKTAVNEHIGIYTFVVDRHATKNEIAKAIFKTYQVKPIKVCVMNNRGKGIRFGKYAGSRSNWKKAMVHLKKGDVLNLHVGT